MDLRIRLVSWETLGGLKVINEERFDERKLNLGLNYDRGQTVHIKEDISLAKEEDEEQKQKGAQCDIGHISAIKEKQSLNQIKKNRHIQNKHNHLKYIIYI